MTTPKTPSKTGDSAAVPEETGGPLWDQFAVQLAELEDLVSAQFRECDEVLERCSALLEQAERVEHVRQELYDQQAALQRHCETVSAEIADEYEHLREAWDRLERQQRQAALSTNLPQAGEPVHPATSPAPVATPAAVPPVNPRPGRSPSLTDLDIRDTWTPRMNDAAAVQFQQMKRQIRTHAAENRKKSES